MLTVVTLVLILTLLLLAVLTCPRTPWGPVHPLAWYPTVLFTVLAVVLMVLLWRF